MKMQLKNPKQKFFYSLEQIKDKLRNDPGFISMKRFDFSIDKLEQRYPDGPPDHIIAQALGLEPEELKDLYRSIVQKLKTSMGV